MSCHYDLNLVPSTVLGTYNKIRLEDTYGAALYFAMTN